MATKACCFAFVATTLLLLPSLASAAENINFSSPPTSLKAGASYTVNGQVTWGSGDTAPKNVQGGVEQWNATTMAWDNYQNWNSPSFSGGGSPATWSDSSTAPTAVGSYRFFVKSIDSNGNVLASSTSNFTVN
jgi:hypothetical protein